MGLLKKIFVLMLLAALMSGCSRRSKVEFGENQSTIQPAPLQLTRFSELEWKVGKERRQTISRGFTLALDVPRLSNSDLRELAERHQVDAWYFQIRRGPDVLQRYYIPLAPGARQFNSVLFNVQYASSAISMRFANSPCPAFDHRKIITGHRFVQVQRNTDRLTLGPMNESRLNAQLPAFEIRPPSINAGHSLRGIYSVDVALFNLQHRLFKSNLLTYPRALEVTGERDGSIEGCEGYQIPDQDSGGGLEEFRFGR